MLIELQKMAYVKRNRLWERSGFLHIWQQLQVKVTCMKFKYHARQKYSTLADVS